MKKFLAGCVCILVYCPVIAQSKKVPVYELATDKTTEPDAHAAKGLISGFTQVVLRPGYDGSVDTAELYTIKYYPTGYLQSIESYDYIGAHRFRDAEDDAFFKNRSRISGGDRTTYEYDRHGNITSRKTYNIAVANSEQAGMVTLFALLEQEKMKETEKYVDDGELSVEDEEAIDSAVRERVERLIDSISNSKGEEIAHLQRDENYEYDKNDNPTYSYEPLSKNNFRYSYTYYPDGFVKVQRSHYHSTINSYLYYSTTEHHFTWDGKGHITSVKTYIAERDSGDIATEKNLRRAEYTHYNKQGLPDTILYMNEVRPVMHIITYKGRRQKTFTVMREEDTSSHTEYLYDDGLLKEARRVGYRSGRKMGSDRRVISYDKNGLPVEELLYISDDSFKNEELKQQSLFFYGLPSDKQTAKRRLTRIERQEEEIPKTAGLVLVESEPDDPEEDTPEVPQPTIFTYVEQMPEFIGDINKYIVDNLQYPTAAEKDGITGRVTVRFVVGKDGAIREPKILRGIREDVDNEALRIVQNMPKWRPGKQNGMAVDVYYTLPVTFKLR